MEAANMRAEALRHQIEAAEKELRNLKDELARIEEKSDTNGHNGDTSDEISEGNNWPFSPEEYLRYGRQMVVPNIGIQGE